MLPEIIAEIVVEHIDANSDKYRLSSLCVADRCLVESDQPIAIIETSKSVFEIVSPASGRLFFAPGVVTAKAVQAGQLLAVVARPDATEVEVSHRWHCEKPSAPPQDTIVRGATFSKAAISKLRELGISPDVFIDKGLVTAADVETYFKENAM